MLQKANLTRATTTTMFVVIVLNAESSMWNAGWHITGAPSNKYLLNDWMCRDETGEIGNGLKGLGTSSCICIVSRLLCRLPICSKSHELETLHFTTHFPSTQTSSPQQVLSNTLWWAQRSLVHTTSMACFPHVGKGIQENQVSGHNASICLTIGLSSSTKRPPHCSGTLL